MNEYQKPLRGAARKALAAQGYERIEHVRGAGGARLECLKDGAAVLALVRTSADRAVGWMRDEGGGWRGLDDAGLVVVATLDNEAGPTRAEMFAFAPADLRAAYDAMLAARLAKAPELSRAAPIFVYLDDRKAGLPGGGGGVGVKAKALWTATVPLPGVAAPAAGAPAAGASGRAGFVARVREQFARMMGVPVESVAVEFRVTV